MSFATQERVGSFINVSVVVLEDLSSEIPIDVTHQRDEHIDLSIEWIDAIAAGRCRHSRSRRRVVVVIFHVSSGSVCGRVERSGW